MIRIFTDGACKGNGKAHGRASFSAWFPEHPTWSFARLVPEGETQTNQRAELRGIHGAVEHTIEMCGSPENHDLELYTDSMYAKQCLTEWIPNWLRNDWKNSEGKPVIHRDLIESTSIMLSKFKSYKITHVKAHTNAKDDLSRNNAVADKMAVEILSNPEKKEVKQVSTEKGPFESLPLTMMGPPMEESKIIEWCKTHLDELDESALKSALFTAFQKSVKKNGYGIELQRMNKTRVVRLISTTLIREGVTIIKEE